MISVGTIVLADAGNVGSMGFGGGTLVWGACHCVTAGAHGVARASELGEIE